MSTPLYLFTGFLESGKTKFIQETFEDPRFEDGSRTLLLVCEEGVEEYDTSRFAVKDWRIETIESKDDLTAERLLAIEKDYAPEKIIVEYNGMWMLDDLYARLPESWLVYQQMLFFDGSTFDAYNANLRSLVVDKLKGADMTVFNRVPKERDVLDFHKIVRGVSRRSDIAYEYEDGSVSYDDIEDPLPFDKNAAVIEIADADYALWYRDLMDDMASYDGKTVRFTGAAARDRRMADDEFVVGRHIMTCCEADITYSALVCKWPEAASIRTRDWVSVTAKIRLERHRIYTKKGPVLCAVSVLPGTEPKQPVATFY